MKPTRPPTLDEFEAQTRAEIRALIREALEWDGKPVQRDTEPPRPATDDLRQLDMFDPTHAPA